MNDEALSKRDQITSMLWRFLPAIAVALMATVLILVYLNRSAGEEVDSSKLKFAKVHLGTISPDLKGIGTLRSASELWLTSPSDGFVERVIVTPGETVKKGDVLLELANKDLAKEFELSRLAVTEAQSRLSTSEYEVTINRLSAESSVIKAKAAFDTAEREWSAYQELMKTHIASKLDAERAKTAAASSARLLENASRELRVINEIGSKRESTIQSELDSRQALLKLVKDQIEALQIRAPIAGVVTALDANRVAPGQRISQGQQLLRLVDPRRMLADIRVPSSQIAQVHVGAPATVRIFDVPYSGTVAEVDPTVIDQHSRVVVTLEGVLPQAAGTGLEIEGRIKAGHEFSALVADFRHHPLLESGTRGYVYRRSADGKTIHRVDVQILGVEGTVVGFGFGGGVAEGDEIVVRGLAPDESRDTLTLANPG